MANRKIGLRDVRSLRPLRTIWDAGVTGFGARRQRSAAVTYVLFYRTDAGRQRWYTIGRHGSPWTPETARAEAQRLLGKVAEGGDPATAKRTKRHAAIVSELCDMYLADAEAGRLLTRRNVPKKTSTLVVDRGRIERHIKPLLGRIKVAAISREDIDGFMHDVAAGKTASNTKSGKKRGLARVRGGKTAASRAVGLLGAIFTYSVRHRMRPDNPVHGVTRFADVKRERRLSEDEYKALGEALRRAEAASIWPAAIAAAQFLVLTGWRRGEVLGLRWQEIDLTRRTVTLGDTKTGSSVRPLSAAACNVLQSLSQADCDLVFRPARGVGRMTGFPKLWAKIAKLGGLAASITPHTLRHSFASLAGDLGYSETTIAAMVGHKGRSITSRYVHAADAVLLAAADVVANRTVELLADAGATAEIIPLSQKTRRA